MTSVLLIGYGNSLRGDDVVGRLVAERIACEPGELWVRGCHQLTPELAVDVSAVDVVLFVDATRDLAPAAVAWREVRADEVEPARLSHACTPASLLALSAAAYGKLPRAFAIGVGVSAVDAGEQLSEELAAALPAIVDRVRQVVRHLTGEGRGAA